MPSSARYASIAAALTVGVIALMHVFKAIHDWDGDPDHWNGDGGEAAILLCLVSATAALAFWIWGPDDERDPEDPI